MKKLKYLVAALVVAMGVTSCEDDGGTSKVDVIGGNSANIRKDAALPQSLNYLDIQADKPVTVGITIDNVYQSDFVAADIVGFYKKGTAIERKVMKTNVTNLPAKYSFTATDLIALFNVLNTKADFAVTDELTVTAELIKADGTRIKLFNDNGTQNYGVTVNNLAAVSNFQKFGFVCPLNDASIFNGSYKVTQDQWSDYSVNAAIPVVYDAAFGTMKFKVLASNNPYLVNAATAYMIVTVSANGTATVTANELFNYGGTDIFLVTGTGTVNACTGAIDLSVKYGALGPYKLSLVK